MNKDFFIQYVDHRDAKTAARLHAVQMAAYRQEADLLGVKHFPPLEVSVQEIQELPEKFLAALEGEEIIGATSVCPDDETDGQNIASLVVAPARQREGIAGRLMTALLVEYGNGLMTVQTAAKNSPALALYAKFGFVEFKRWCVGEEALELVKLLRNADDRE
ncbi:MAG: GNAT family N-acetyltransferase [Candidatus Riflebacteria bacterium]|nr:GNAT family N-acetyltransferase [Candidatus Riflebacteria bacterium]